MNTLLVRKYTKRQTTQTIRIVLFPVPSLRNESPVCPSKIPFVKSSLVCMMRAFIGACALGCLPLASTLRFEQKGMWNPLLDVDFLGSMCRWFISYFIQYVLCFKMSQSVQVFGRKVSKKWTIFLVVLCWPNRHVHCKFNSGSTFGTICFR